MHKIYAAVFGKILYKKNNMNRRIGKNGRKRKTNFNDVF
jgi:hypothetical protein